MSSDSEDSDFEDIRPYFPTTQWSELSSYEKGSYRCAKRNYQAMLNAGLSPRPPQFMAKTLKPKPETVTKRAAAREAAQSAKKKRLNSEERDADWTPEAEDRAGPSRRVKFVPPKMTRAKVQQPAGKQAKKEKKAAVLSSPAESGPSGSSTVDSEKQAEQAAAPDDSRSSRYPKRLGSRKSYAGADGDLADDDDELYCDDCEQSYEGDCPVHGPLIIIADAKVEGKDPERALHTLPPQLAVRQSKIPGAGLGVWTQAPVPRRVRFGPYEGDITAPKSDSGYGWEIRQGGKATHCIDASRESTSNWMRWVNCPRNAVEANLHPYQFKGALYYRTVCDVPANMELLVWYGNSYGKELGIDAKDFKAPPANPGALTGTFPCGACSVCFISPLLLSKHQQSGRCFGEIRRRRAATASGGTPEEGRAAVEPAAPGKDRGKWQCGVCRAAFRYEKDLRRHERIHTGERPFTCSTCGQSFSDSSSLSRHLRSHSGERPFSCSTCGKGFSRSSHLSTHLRSHSGERPFSCSTCGKAFSRSSHLSRHLRSHSGERPFSCSVCTSSFTQKSDMDRHKRRQHPAALHEQNAPATEDTAAPAAATGGSADLQGQDGVPGGETTLDLVSSTTTPCGASQQPAPSHPPRASNSEPVQESGVSSSSSEVVSAGKRGRQSKKGKENRNPVDGV